MKQQVSQMLRVESDPGADAVYIRLSDAPIGYTSELDDNRLIDYSMNPGTPVGIDLLVVSQGVNLTGLPESDTVKKVLDAIGVTSYTKK